MPEFSSIYIIYIYIYICVCVCVRERERERERSGVCYEEKISSVHSITTVIVIISVSPAILSISSVQLL